MVIIFDGIKIGITLENCATELTYLNPVEWDICLPLKFVNSLVEIPINGLSIDIFKNTHLIWIKYLALTS